jgi:hypothetical protein
MRRALERLLLTATTALLLWWPFAYRYTSIGCEWELQVDDELHSVYWRVRWPSDGSVVLARIEHEQRLDRMPEAFDLGATFLKPAQATGAVTFWQNLGFWWLSVDAREAPVPDLVKDAERAFVVGVPHACLLVGTGCAWWLLRSQRRTIAGRKPTVGKPDSRGAA